MIVELRDFLPYWCLEIGCTSEELLSGEDCSDGEAEQNKKRSQNKRRMNLLQWFSAFEAYALAADLTWQWSLASAMDYKCICSEVAARAGVSSGNNQQRRHYLAIIYDQIATDE